MNAAIWLAEKGYVPEFLLRVAIRRLLAQRLAGLGDRDTVLAEWVRHMAAAPVAMLTEKANEQHYEVPPELFKMCLGKNLKYSSCLYEREGVTLDEAEDAMLTLKCERARLKDG